MTKFKYKLDYLDENQGLGCQLINYKQIIKVKKNKEIKINGIPCHFIIITRNFFSQTVTIELAQPGSTRTRSRFHYIISRVSGP